MKLTVVKSHLPDKKYDAIFEGEGVHRVIPFGAAGYDDFTKTKNEDQKNRYIQRHKANENFGDMMSRGALSRYILWNKPTLHESIKDFKKRFSII
jgi:hypothetical protein